MHEAVPEPVGDGMDAHVGYAPPGRASVRHSESVVETVAAGTPTERLPDPERHVVADDRERGRRHLEIGQPHPEGTAAVTGLAVPLLEVPGPGEPHVEAVHDRPLVALL